MMLNLFSIFDPMTSMNLSLNWFSSLFIIMFMPNLYWLTLSLYSMSYLNLFDYLLNELKILMKFKLNKFNIIMLISLFIMIMLNNLMGLYSYIFTSTSHLIYSLTFSLILWISFLMFGWIKNFEKMMIHLVPQGTPIILMPFMVLIETISNIILPWTLAILLSANMIAGHLLITLISNNGTKLMLIPLIIMLLIQNLLMILELSVSIIQAYVFTILSTLYLSEIK